LPLQRVPDVFLNCSPDSDVFDTEDLLDRLMGDTSLADEIVTTFLDDARCQLTDIECLLNRRDWPGVLFRAHTLKGAAATAGAKSLCNVALALEQAGIARYFDRCSELLASASVEFDRFQKIVTPAA